ncbi:MAG: hypothetical protein V3T88_03615 [Nitrosomonadaceae bacterium]
MNLLFPFRGYHVGVGTERQPEGTTPYIQNMRVLSVLNGKLIGGQRGGLQKAYTEQISSASFPIVEMLQVTTVD